MADEDALRGPLEDAYRDRALSEGDESARASRRAAVLAAVRSAAAPLPSPIIDPAANQSSFSAGPHRLWLGAFASIGMVCLVVWMSKPPQEQRMAASEPSSTAPVADVVAMAPTTQRTPSDSSPAVAESSKAGSPPSPSSTTGVAPQRSSRPVRAAPPPAEASTPSSMPSPGPAVQMADASAAAPAWEARSARPANADADVTDEAPPVRPAPSSAPPPNAFAAPDARQQPPSPAAQSMAKARAYGSAELARRSMDVNARDSEGRTALHRAVLTANLAAVRTLVAQGADPALADQHGATPMDLARAANNAALIEALARSKP